MSKCEECDGTGVVAVPDYCGCCEWQDDCLTCDGEGEVDCD